MVSQDKAYCARAIKDTISLLTELGFIVHPTKLVLTPQQDIVSLDVVINTREMTMKLTGNGKSTPKYKVFVEN